MRAITVRVTVTALLFAVALMGAGCSEVKESAEAPPETPSVASVSPQAAAAAARASEAIAAINARVAEYPASFTEEQAVAAVLAFDPTAIGAHVVPAPSVRGPDPSARLYYTFVQVTPNRGYVVEGRSGNVTEVWGRVPGSVVLEGAELSAPLDEEGARRVAKAFLSRVRPGFEYLTPTEWGERWYVQDPEQFGFGWELVDGAGIGLGDRVRVSIDRNTGDAVKYVSQEGGPISISTTPTISADEAVRAVLGDADSTGASAYLHYVGYPFPYERLIWSVSIMSGPVADRITGRQPGIASPVVIDIDAHTGEYITVGDTSPPGSAPPMSGISGDY